MRPPQIAFPALVQDFFLRRLIAQRGASARTIESYRDAFELLLRASPNSAPASALRADARRPRRPAACSSSSTTSKPNAATRPHPQRPPHRASARSCATPRSAIPTSLPVAQRVLAIPTKRFDRPVLGFLSAKRSQAAPRRARPRHLERPTRRRHARHALQHWRARLRDHRPARRRRPPGPRDAPSTCTARDARNASSRSGKAPPRSYAQWLPRTHRGPDAPVFPNRAGGRMSRSGVEHRLRGRSRGRDALPVPRRPPRSRRTRCGTRPRCTCSSPAWTSPSSPSGSATRFRPPPTSTSKPTSR